MKYLTHKAFQREGLGPDTGAVMLKTTMPKSEVSQPQHGGLRGAVSQRARTKPELCMCWFRGTRAPKPFWDSVSQLVLPSLPPSIRNHSEQSLMVLLAVFHSYLLIRAC